jgi:hypothetical protein
MACALKTSAYQRGATRAQLTLVAIDPAPAGHLAARRETAANGFAFSSIEVIP